MIYFCDCKKEIISEHFPELLPKVVTMEVSTHLFFLEVLCRTKDPKYKKNQRESIQLVRRKYHLYSCRNSHERKMAAIVYYGLYPLYKFAVWLKYYK